MSVIKIKIEQKNELFLEPTALAGEIFVETAPKGTISSVAALSTLINGLKDVAANAA